MKRLNRGENGEADGMNQEVFFIVLLLLPLMANKVVCVRFRVRASVSAVRMCR